jgi:DNA-binding NarL/FixJ family response regulator
MAPRTDESTTLLTMLIVEDQHSMRAMLREFVQFAYPRALILEAADGTAALALCGRHDPHLVFMDVGLPDGNGIELTARIKAALPQSAVIVVSQHVGQAYIERAQAAGAFAYVTKDKIFSDLLPIVAQALGHPSDGRPE